MYGLRTQLQELRVKHKHENGSVQESLQWWVWPLFHTKVVRYQDWIFSWLSPGNESKAICDEYVVVCCWEMSLPWGLRDTPHWWLFTVYNCLTKQDPRLSHEATSGVEGDVYMKTLMYVRQVLQPCQKKKSLKNSSSWLFGNLLTSPKKRKAGRDSSKLELKANR